MPLSAHKPVVAVFNASEDTVEMLTVFFRQLGFEAVGEAWPARTPLSFDAAREFVTRHCPHVIVFDVSFPYAHNWERFCEFREADGIRDIPIVLTTTNKKALEEIVGATTATEIIGKPWDMGQLAAAVQRAVPSAANG